MSDPRPNPSNHASVIENTVMASERAIDYLSTLEMSESEKRYCKYQIHRYKETLGILEVTLSGRPVRRVLEIGSGYGHLAFLLKHWYDCEAYAVDILENLDLLLRGRGITFESVDIEKQKIPFEDHYFDLVLFCEVVEHLSPSRVECVVDEIYRVLSENGCFLITTPTRGFLSRMFYPLAHALEKKEHEAYLKGLTGQIEEETEKKGKGVHTKVYTPNELRQLLERAGFNLFNSMRGKGWEISGLTIRDMPTVIKPIRKLLGIVPQLVESDLIIVCVKARAMIGEYVVEQKGHSFCSTS